MGVISDFLGDADISSFFSTLIDNGWYQYIFPFMLVYVIVFTALGSVNLFKDKKAIRVLVAVILGLFSIAFPIADSCEGVAGNSVVGGCTLGDLMASLFPGVTAFTLGILALYIVAGILGVNLMNLLGEGRGKTILTYSLGIIGIIFVVFFFGKGFGWWGGSEASDKFDWIKDFFSDPLLYILVAFGLIFWWINKDDDDECEHDWKDVPNSNKKKCSKCGKVEEK